MSEATCATCGEKTVTVPRASGGYVQILVAASENGLFMRLPHGRHAGKYVKVDGVLLDKLRANGTDLFIQHTCERG